MLINSYSLYPSSRTQLSKNDMTSDTDGGYTVTESTYYSGRAGWRAFDGSTATYSGWYTASGNATGWLQMQLPAAKIVTYYKIYQTNDTITRAPKDWTFQGSNNGADWDTLHTVTDQTGWTASQWREFYPTTTNYYSYYKINITANNGYSDLKIDELVLEGYA